LTDRIDDGSGLLNKSAVEAEIVEFAHRTALGDDDAADGKGWQMAAGRH
jgi:hypothetical protein